MKRFRKILATTDLSSEAASAVSYAAHLAKAQGAQLTILHVPHTTTLLFTDFTPPLDMVNIDVEIEEAARKSLEGWVKRHVRGLDKVDVRVRPGVTHEVICETADEIGASVIVMATHGRRGFAHALLGSVTERVLRDAPCPVLVVKPPAPAVDVSPKKKKKQKKAARRK